MEGVFQTLKGGGVMMVPLLFCSVLLIALAIERLWTLRKLNDDGDELIGTVRSTWNQGPEKTIQACSEFRGALGRVFIRGLKNSGRTAEAIEMALEQEAANELPGLEANLPVIKTIVNIAPLLGLLGTIVGMISAFRVASQAGLSNPSQILGGISEALISTFTGISIAVIGFIIYNYFANQSKKIIEDIEYYGAELVNLLTDRVD